jgi:hypothetical protein
METQTQQKRLFRRAYEATKDALRRSSKYAKSAAIGLALGTCVAACGGRAVPFVEPPIDAGTGRTDGTNKTDAGLVVEPGTALLRIQLERNAKTVLNAAQIPSGPCTLEVPHLYIDAPVGAERHFKVQNGSNGPGHDTSFYVAVNGGDCNGKKFNPLAVFIRKSPVSAEYTMHTHKDECQDELSVIFPYVGREGGDSWAGRIIIADINNQGPGWAKIPLLKALVGLTEYLGDRPDCFPTYTCSLSNGVLFGVKGDGTSSTMSFDAIVDGGYALRKGNLIYQRSDPSGEEFVAQGFTTERGSMIKTVSDSLIEVEVSGVSPNKPKPPLPPSGVTENESRSYWAAARPLTITGWSNHDGILEFTVQNLGDEPVVLTGLGFENVQSPLYPTPLKPGESTIITSGADPCTGPFEIGGVSLIYSKGAVTGITEAGDKPIVGICAPSGCQS